MKLIDPYTGLMECRVCLSWHNSSLKPGGGYHRGCWQCSNEACSTNKKVWDEQKRRWVKVGYHPRRQETQS
jgi:hypothetical protein